jgi:hypothetical protein
MNKNVNLEKVGGIIFLLFAVTSFFSFLVPKILPLYLSPVQIGQYYSDSNLFSIIPILFRWSINIFLAIWVLLKSDEAKQAKWGWFFLTMVFGINAIILFYFKHLMTARDNRTD